jgi:hypothetical protein
VKFSTQPIANQNEALQTIAALIARGIEDPRVHATALKIVRDCAARDDECELSAIYEAVKNGDSAVKALSRGFPYRADPKTVDWFQGASRSLAMCESGACGGDCDDATILIASLAGTIGFTVGARAYGRGRAGAYSHVYPVAVVPKGASAAGVGAFGAVPPLAVGLDTTVPSAYVGWQPPPGHYKTAWVGR